MFPSKCSLIDFGTKLESFLNHLSPTLHLDNNFNKGHYFCINLLIMASQAKMFFFICRMCVATLNIVHKCHLLVIISPNSQKIWWSFFHEVSGENLTTTSKPTMSTICPLVGHYNRHSHHLEILAPPIINQILGITCNLV